MRIGDLSVEVVVDGETRRPLEVLYPDAPADELAAERRWLDPVSDDVVMTIGSWLVRMGSRTVLFDCGLGPEPVGSFNGGVFRSTLALTGLGREQITDVVFTHLHVDHIGWAVQGGEPYFPNATYHCDARDWAHFTSPDYLIEPWELAGSRPDVDAAAVRLAPLAEQITLWEGDGEVLPGITAIDASGHTPGTCAFLLESTGQRGLILGDIVHSVPELLHGWRFAVHHNPSNAVASIKRIRELLADEAIPCTAAHLTGMAWGQIRPDGNGFRWEPLQPGAETEQ